MPLLFQFSLLGNKELGDCCKKKERKKKKKKTSSTWTVSFTLFADEMCQHLHSEVCLNVYFYLNQIHLLQSLCVYSRNEIGFS